MSNEQEYRVTEADETSGFARCASESTAQRFHCELFIPDASGRQLVRLHAGDQISGVARGTAIVDVRLVQRASPPPALVASLASLADAVAPHGLSLPAPLEGLADQVWREDPKRTAHDASSTLKGLITAQLTYLFDRDDHPFDDRKLAPRMAAALRNQGAQLDVQEQLNEEGDVKGFQILPSGPFLPFGKDGDWEQPAGCYRPLVDFANRVLAQLGRTTRWHHVLGDFLLADAGLVDLLAAHQIIER